MYVGGTLVRTQAVTGNIVEKTNALRIGGNSVWGEYFQGLIDNVRIYNRALSQTEITTDMNGAISASGGAVAPAIVQPASQPVATPLARSAGPAKAPQPAFAYLVNTQPLAFSTTPALPPPPQPTASSRAPTSMQAPRGTGVTAGTSPVLGKNPPQSKSFLDGFPPQTPSLGSRVPLVGGLVSSDGYFELDNPFGGRVAIK